MDFQKFENFVRASSGDLDAVLRGEEQERLRLSSWAAGGAFTSFVFFYAQKAVEEYRVKSSFDLYRESLTSCNGVLS